MKLRTLCILEIQEVFSQLLKSSVDQSVLDRTRGKYGL